MNEENFSKEIIDNICNLCYDQQKEIHRIDTMNGNRSYGFIRIYLHEKN